MANGYYCKKTLIIKTFIEKELKQHTIWSIDEYFDRGDIKDNFIVQLTKCKTITISAGTNNIMVLQSNIV